VASFNFPESALLAEVYSQALEHAGLPVQRELNLGPREQVLPALQQGLVDIVPEYLGSALDAVDPAAAADRHDEVAIRDALARAVNRWRLQVLAPALAQDQNGLAVTTATAARLSLRTTSALQAVAGRLTLGGPSECPSRPYCLQGLEGVYGLRFSKFLAFDTESQRLAALDQQVVDVAVLFTTDGNFQTDRYVLLDDDRRLQPVENVVPVVSRRVLDRYGPAISQALDAVSARLSTYELIVLNWRVQVLGAPAAGEARSWLQQQGLLH
jgi:osmoprotectant transport system substrate-binding protein